MKRQLFACLALAATLLPSALGAQERRVNVSPWLEPLIDQPTRDIPDVLRSPLGGEQGRDRLAGREALSLHLRTRASREELEALGIEVTTLRNGLATVTVLPETLPALAAHPDVFSIILPYPFEPALRKSLPDTGVPSLRTFSNGTFTGATGAGVVVGVVDSGIDFDHPNFLDAQGNSRIAFLLDQTTNKECTAATIDAGQCTEQDTAVSFGHGTHVTGIAAGNGAAPDENGASFTHVGVAPESTIVFVKTTFQSDSIVKGLEYIFAKADLLGMPAVINLSIESPLGAHEGTSLIEEAIDNLVTAKPGRAVVVAAGNMHEDAIHAEAQAQENMQTAGPSFVVPTYSAQGGANNDSLWITGYYAASDDVIVELVSPSGLSYTQSLKTSSCLPTDHGIDGSVLLCNVKVSKVGDATASREIFIRIWDGVASKPPKKGTWKINLLGNTIAGKGEVDFWVSSGLGGKRAQFSTLVDPSETVNTPGTSRQAITVGAHVTRPCWDDYNGTPRAFTGTLGDIADFGAIGPTRDGRAKPDLTAPGKGVVSSMAAEVQSALVNSNYAHLIVNDHYIMMPGTSMATPHVTGAVALLLQKDPTATNATLRSRLFSAARDDAFTRQHDGILFTNYTFGAGKLDLGRWGWVDPQETNDLPSQAFAILSGQSRDGYVEQAADVDYFLLQGMQAGDTVNASLTSLPQDYALALQGQLVPLDHCNPGGMSTKATSNNPGTANESIVHTATTGIQVIQGPPAFLRVTSPVGATSNSDSYQIKAVLTRPETTGAHATTGTAQKLPDFLEMNVIGAIASGETDFYRISAMPGDEIVLWASGPGKLLSIRDANGVQVTSGFVTASHQVPSGGFLIFPKTFYVVVSGSNGGYSLNLKLQ